VPVTFRAPTGGGFNGGPFHSQCPEMYYVHTPGLKIVAPGTVYDAKGLLKAAIRDDNPVIYFEHKHLYRRLKESIPSDDYIVPIGKACVRLEGSSLTVLTYGAMLHVCHAAMERIPNNRGAVEIIDLRSLKPLDEETILESVKKTGKVLIVHEDRQTGGIAGELAALVADKAFEYLDGPIRRVTAPDTPVPYAPPLENFYLPNEEDVANAVMELLAY